jgi:L-alanine-DL-glutamate epimerase-like enolase superfamily enzyme
LATQNCEIQEIVRAFYYGWYSELMTALPPVENGRIRAPEGSGLGIALQPDALKRKDCVIRRSD